MNKQLTIRYYEKGIPKKMVLSIVPDTSEKSEHFYEYGISPIPEIADKSSITAARLLLSVMRDSSAISLPPTPEVRHVTLQQFNTMPYITKVKLSEVERV